MTAGPRSDRFGIWVAVLGGIFVALATVLVVVLVTRDGGSPTTTAAGPTFTTAPETSLTSTSTTTTTGASSTTVTSTSTTTTSTTTTTTAPPFAGTLEQKTGTVQGTPSGTLTGIRSAHHEGYTRVVFDFAPGGLPGYWVGYNSPGILTLLLYPMSAGTPYEAGIFDSGGSHAIGKGSVVAVEDAGMGGGSGEWAFDIALTGQKPFFVGTLAGPPRLYVDIAD
jgi:hypothetical protein